MNNPEALQIILSLIAVVIAGGIGAIVGWVLGAGKQRSTDQARIEAVMLKEKELEAQILTFRSRS